MSLLGALLVVCITYFRQLRFDPDAETSLIQAHTYRTVPMLKGMIRTLLQLADFCRYQRSPLGQDPPSTNGSYGWIRGAMLSALNIDHHTKDLGGMKITG
ncbi:hypothetical protein [Pseudomonas fluorescens]|uniref:hypothetical protein n=1 Tax=Pseudomonas fluorescens TaxID=294 RepID=UPI0012DA4397|nr:hypothetical protein [Pseudomonas fluorescens]